MITASSAEVLIRGDVQAWGAGPQQDVPLAHIPVRAILADEAGAAVGEDAKARDHVRKCWARNLVRAHAGHA